MRNELLRWAEEQKGVYANGDWRSQNLLEEFISKINSIPVPSVEGYLEGKVDNNVLHLKNGGITNYLTITEALTALRELKEDCEDRLCENAYGWVLKCNELKAEVERLKGDGWISVEDRLPEEKGYYLGCEDWNITAKAFVVYFDKEENIFYQKCTHWRPLPNPPKQ